MGDTAWFSCAAAILHFWGLVCVCLRAPERRTFQKNARPPPPMAKIEEGQEEDLEETSDDNGILDEDHDLHENQFLNLEKGIGEISKNGIEKETEKKDMSAKGKFYDLDELVTNQQCDAADLSLAMIPNMSSGEQCCSPLSTAKPMASPEPLPDIPSRELANPLSPVDCIIEGFDVATDLSHIDVCRTMVFSPGPRMLELEAARVDEVRKFYPTKLQHSDDETKNKDSTVNGAAETSEPPQAQTPVQEQSADDAAISKVQEELFPVSS